MYQKNGSKFTFRAFLLTQNKKACSVKLIEKNPPYLKFYLDSPPSLLRRPLGINEFIPRGNPEDPEQFNRSTHCTFVCEKKRKNRPQIGLLLYDR